MRPWRVWLASGAALFLLATLFNLIVPEELPTVLLWVLFILWLAASAMVVSWLAWRWLTYRVGVRLFLSYLLIGVSSFLVCALFAVFVLYMIMGQYTSVRFGSAMDRALAELGRDCTRVLDSYHRSGQQAAALELDTVRARAHSLAPRVLWRARLGGQQLTGGDDVALPTLDWLRDGLPFVARHGASAFLVAAAADDEGSMVSAILPLDDETAKAVSAAMWFDVYFAPVDEHELSDVNPDTTGDGDPTGESDDDSMTIGWSTDRDEPMTFSLGDGSSGVEELWQPWTDSEEGLMHRPWVFWFRLAEGVRDLSTGEELEEPNVISLLRTSPANVWRDFVLSRYELGSHLRGIMAGLGMFLVVIYGVALLMAATMIVSITRSTSRLTRGAKAVESGRLDYRIKVKRHDQLGDLAVAFNRMTQSVEEMLVEVAEKERLASELELAREIQEQLLPERHLRHGSLSVYATFRPAAAVGGDYFDVFPLGDNRLIVVVGDVAGHGLPTGLLMASLKSSVAALVHEGYSGSKLLNRTNHLLREASSRRTMATLCVVEIDVGASTVDITNAGHPPVFLLTPEGAEELLTSSLPLGFKLFRPSRLERRLSSDCRIVLYSDGLVEARDDNGDPFGYERLAEILGDAGQLSAAELTAVLLGALDRHTGGREPDDDLTIVVVETNSRGKVPDAAVS